MTRYEKRICITEYLLAQYLPCLHGVVYIFARAQLDSVRRYYSMSSLLAIMNVE